MKNTIITLGLLNIVIAFLCCGSNAYAVGATTPYTTYEAESGVVSNGASVVTLTLAQAQGNISSPQMEASGRAYVALAGTGQKVTWTNNTGQSVTAINFRASVPPAKNRVNYTNDGSPNTYTLDLYVNGTFRQAITLSSAQTWLYEQNTLGFGTAVEPSSSNPNPHIFWDEMHTFITGAAIAPGSTITLQQDSTNTAAFYWIDCIDLEAPTAISQPSGSLSITSYGAVANNPSINNATAIQNCINAAAAQGVAAWVPAGTFYLTGNINATNATLEGAGMWYSSLYFHPNGYVYTTSTSNSATVQNVYLGSNASCCSANSQASSGFSPSGSNWVLNSVWIEHHGEGAIWASGQNGTVENCRINNSYGDGINLNTNNQGATVGNNLVVQNTHIRGSTDDSLACGSNIGDPGQGLTIGTNQEFINNTLIAPDWASPMSTYGGTDFLLQGNLCQDGATGNGIGVGTYANNYPLVNVVVQGNTVLRCGSYVDNQGIAVGGPTTSNGGSVNGAFVANNTVIGSYFNGIATNQTATDTVLQDNTVIDFVGAGILLSNAGNDILLGNNVIGKSGQSAVLNQANLTTAAVSTPVIAASYNSAASGIQTENCSEGGLDVGYISNGSYTAYNAINLAGAQRFTARVAAGSTGGTINIHTGSPTGTLIGTATVPPTGGWQNWADVSCSITGASGVQPVYLVYAGSSGNVCNIEWFSFSDYFSAAAAASFNSQNGGVGTQGCSEGGLNADSIVNGSWTSYNNVNLNGATSFYVRVASAGAGGSIQVRAGSATGTLLGTCTVPVTGGWQTWTTVNCPLTGASGTQNLYLVYTGGGGYLFNVEWFAFSQPLPYGLTEATTYNSASSGIGTEGSSEGGTDVGWIQNGAYTVYNAIDMTGITGFSARVAAPSGSGGTINVHLDSPTGTLVGSCSVAPTGGWQTWTTDTCSITPTTGYHNIYLVYTGGGGYLLNLEWFAFSQPTPVLVTAASSYNNSNSVQTENCSEGGLDVGYIGNGSYTEYNNVNLNGVTSFVARVASPSGGSTITIHVGSPTGTVIGTCAVPATGGWETWTTAACNLTGASGTQNVYLVYTSGMNIEWFSVQ